MKLRIASILGCLALLAGCGSTSGGSTTATGKLAELRVGVVGSVVAEVAVADLRASATLPGLVERITFHRLNTPDQIRTAVTSGSVDVVTLPTSMAANLTNRGMDLVLLGVLDARLLHLVGPPDGPTAVTALRGKTIHLPFRGDAADTTLRHVLARSGLLAGRDVTLAYHNQLPELVSGLAAGQFQYAVLPEHTASLAVQAATAAGHPTTTLIDLQQEWHRHTGNQLAQTALVVRRDVARAKPGLVDPLNERFSAGVARMTNESATTELATVLGAPPPVIATALARLEPAYRTGPQARADVEALLSVFRTDNPDAIGGRLPDDVFYRP